jgi:excisionase family DNA binding protein
MAEITKLLTPGQVAEILGVHEKTAERLARRGELPGFRVGRYWRFDSEELSRWISAKSQGGIDRPTVAAVASRLPAVPSKSISTR